jgi:hypothetical protein
MKYRAIGRTRGDETTPYAVSDYKARTVGEFIQEVLTENRGDWGHIAVKRKGYGFGGSPSIEYRYGELLEEMPEKWRNLEIRKIESCGGWSCMDYLIWDIDNLDE